MTVLGIVLIIYGVFCIAIGLFKPGMLWKIVKVKLGKNKSDKFTQNFVYIWGLIAVIAGIIILL
ncbi:hypothetical protein KHQ82_00090 [Mycoplasmatota bacterium]|nr:hypothetical protein KHQ82_00090 [Mycoplasmatota bacterium]